jgi:hypothetical protein
LEPGTESQRSDSGNDSKVARLACVKSEGDSLCNQPSFMIASSFARLSAFFGVTVSKFGEFLVSPSLSEFFAMRFSSLGHAADSLRVEALMLKRL